MQNGTAKLLYAREHIYNGSWYSGIHAHGYVEFFYITCGEGNFNIAQDYIAVKKGDVLAINTSVAHTEISSKTNPLGYIVLGIGNIELSLSEQQNSGYAHIKSGDFLKKAGWLFENIVAESENETKGVSSVAHYLLMALLQLFLRETKAYTQSSEQANALSKECVQVKRYIDTNYKEKITLDSLSRLAHINKYYLVHSFKKAYNITPIGYLQLCRIMQARRLLTETDLPVFEIAEALGFSSTSSFTQCFRRIAGITPSQQRSQTF